MIIENVKSYCTDKTCLIYTERINKKSDTIFIYAVSPLIQTFSHQLLTTKESFISDTPGHGFCIISINNHRQDPQ